MNRIKLKSYAKVNLCLNVIGKRQDNYHEIVSLMQKINLYDDIEIALDNKGISVASDNSDLPAGKGNLAYKAAELFLEETKKDIGVRIFINKRIPLGAGLGGGSSNAAYVLSGLAKLTKAGLSKQKLLGMSKELGADAPFFIFNNTAIASGIGEKLDAVVSMPPMWYVLIYPGFSVNTKWAYQNLNLILTRNEKDINILRIYNSINDIADILHNDLESVAAQKFPVIIEIKQRLIDVGAYGALMSGSGSAVFGIFPDKKKAMKAYSILDSQGGWNVYVAEGV